MNEYFEVLLVQGARIDSKINVKMTKSLRLGISEDEKVELSNERLLRWATSFTLVVLLVKTDS